MARKFLYIIAFIIGIFIVGAFTLKIFGDEISEYIFVPDVAFVEQRPLDANIYENQNMWFSKPVKDSKAKFDDPSLWLPQMADDKKDDNGGDVKVDNNSPANNISQDEDNSSPVTANPVTANPVIANDDIGNAAIFFIHPTSYLATDNWNAPLDDTESQQRAKTFLRGMASALNNSGEIWAPRYRQAAFGSFLTDKPEGGKAIDAAYRDVELAFAHFIKQQPKDKPIILAGHSQGALHLTHLMKNHVAGKLLAKRVVAAYIIGWPISINNDLPYMGLPACKSLSQSGCIFSYQSYAEPADYDRVVEFYGNSIGFDGKKRALPMLCTNPLNGGSAPNADAAMNMGTLKPNADLTKGELIAASVGANCDANGFLLIGEPPELGQYVLPGNNYHVYDYPLFWANIRNDAKTRLNLYNKVL
ncbi:hypothetical protein LPB140_08375 [Sphingorhabdus lutea]|uniref:DUF3089 domain-containing protein n=1 Tax=Sphingorhabdus lutea TaxID=1913578 RepID=A0A1L3JCE0_9SPHN|nr:DUF3089 domain-containing protein [Sphingorhabdus lutea]APG62801.1 hypothetical protein LPB140_08375 [Sphingorhabdus lutea]